MRGITAVAASEAAPKTLRDVLAIAPKGIERKIITGKLQKCLLGLFAWPESTTVFFLPYLLLMRSSRSSIGTL